MVIARTACCVHDHCCCVSVITPPYVCDDPWDSSKRYTSAPGTIPWVKHEEKIYSEFLWQTILNCKKIVHDMMKKRGEEEMPVLCVALNNKLRRVLPTCWCAVMMMFLCFLCVVALGHLCGQVIRRDEIPCSVGKLLRLAHTHTRIDTKLFSSEICQRRKEGEGTEPAFQWKQTFLPSPRGDTNNQYVAEQT